MDIKDTTDTTETPKGKLKRRFLFAILPLILAFVLLGSVFIVPFHLGDVSSKKTMRAASSISSSIYKSNLIKKQAMRAPEYVPFIGSSELNRFDITHPSVLAAKYNRDYTPFLLGSAGTQSLSHFLMLYSMRDVLEDKKAVFIVSPQWFQKKGIDEGSFEGSYSPLQLYEWLCDANPADKGSQYFASRMLTFDFIAQDATLKSSLEYLSSGRRPTKNLLKHCALQKSLLKKEDSFFGRYFPESHEQKIAKRAKQLPAQYDYETIKKVAAKYAKKEANNNPYLIKNSFYNIRIKPVEKRLKNSQTKLDYRSSPEFGDFELVLSQFAENNMDVMFIFPPINSRWTAHTGLSDEMLQAFYEKLATQLNDQGFTNIVDLSNCGKEPYFMEDTIHLGWLGWLAMDKAVEPFLANTQNIKETENGTETNAGNDTETTRVTDADSDTDSDSGPHTDTATGDENTAEQRSQQKLLIDSRFYTDEWCTLK
ncbi:MAG: D-alanyl-lipoteichoic acid biosynthesis protein DltD [Clostridiales Family XIII bacterium]|jgi:D-alanine transfer protein|nr:D-alanyl-lipoteichoic acid biosynthesis protein DltD [Clostridiales Family XIII bacterium]